MVIGMLVGILLLSVCAALANASGPRPSGALKWALLAVAAFLALNGATL